MRSNLVVLMATLAFAGPACAIAAAPAASASGGTSSPPISASSGGFVSSGSSGHSSSSGSSSGSARSSNGGGGGGWTGHNGAGAGSGARGFVSEDGFSRSSAAGFNHGEFAGAHSSIGFGGQELPAIRSLAHGAAIAVHSDAQARMHPPHRPRPDYNFNCGTRGASAVCYAGFQYATPDDLRWWYCSESTPAIERTLYCDRIEKTKVLGR